MTEAELQGLYERYAHVIYHRALRIMGNEEDASDAVQETFARVLRGRDGFRDESSPLTWMYQISTNWCLNQIRNRRSRGEKRVEHREAIESNQGSLAGSEEFERAQAVRKLLERLDEESRRIVVHLYFDDMTRNEVAERVGISLPTLRKRLKGVSREAVALFGNSLFVEMAFLLLSWMVVR